ncbi:hypothetical protein LCGC14_1052390 [marine sediment metagenome]|uniref:Carbamoyltransferase n=1 Tax=marine sediment metagenome TaxID=412755 RepID=A0A0F9MNF5_9ZZZZ
MKILGIGDAHDASVALMVDGEIIAAVQEERFSLLKGDYGYPKHSIDYCLEFANLKPEDIDIVTVPSHGWNPVLIKLKRNANFSVEDWKDEQFDFWKWELGLAEFEVDGCRRYENYYDIYKERAKDWQLDKYYPFDHLIDQYQNKFGKQDIIKEAQKIRLKYIQEQFPKSKIKVTTHEDAHTYYSYYGSHLVGQEVLALTAEGVGDYSNSTVSIMGDFNKPRKELSFSRTCEIGHIFQYVTLLLGMKPAQHEYKVMGLAPYSNKYEEEKSYQVFKNILKVDEDLRIVYDKKPRDLYFHFREALEGHRFDGTAAGLQRWTEEILCKWVTKCVEKTGIRKLVVSGGVFQNIKACKAISELDCVDDISVLPATGDTSTSIGACYYQNGGGKPLEHMYLGPDIESMTYGKYKKLKEKYDIRSHASVNGFGYGGTQKVAKLLSEGKIIARCSGRMEFGQRALGNRTIMADPRNPKIVKRLNEAIKNRDFWMPFTPSILKSHFHEYVVNTDKLDARFMCMAFESTCYAEQDLPAAIHPADTTIRPQEVSVTDNKEYFDIINEFGKLTGVPAILNTSFNLHGEPIVLGAKEALRVFENSDIDGLILNDYLILKK